MNINDKLASLKYNKANESHLSVDNDLCMRCKDKCCTYICPAKVYEWNEDKCIMTIRYENCLECGACRICCPHNAIDWKYPRANKGITYKNI